MADGEGGGMDEERIEDLRKKKEMYDSGVRFWQ